MAKVSPSRSTKSNQTDSVLTESTDEESNFIAMLQYKDAFHLLGLNEQLSPDPDEIRAAYTTCREQTIALLERCEANEKAARGSFLISQSNYLELKLNALDQAIYELLPEDGDGHDDGGDDDNDRQSNQQHQQPGVSSSPLQPEVAIDQHRRQVGPNSAEPQTRPTQQQHTEKPRSSNARSLPKDDDDDLDTIDIYFNSPKPTNEPKASDQSDVMSMITWDVSSIWDAASESGLSEVLGSLNKAEDRSSFSAPKSSTSRPPLTINRAIVSPRSITDFPTSTHDRSRHDRPTRKNAPTARGRTSRPRPQSTTDAVRKGMMRAFDEDNSECVSLDFEDDPQRGKKQSAVRRENQHHETIRTASSDRQVKRDGQLHNRARDDSSSSDDQNSKSSADDKIVSDRRNKRRTSNRTEPMPEDDFYESLVQSGLDSYNAVLESSVQISNQLCDAFQACWVDGGTAFENSGADEESRADDMTGVHTEGESTAFNTVSSFSKCGSKTKLGDFDKRRLV